MFYAKYKNSKQSYIKYKALYEEIPLPVSMVLSDKKSYNFHILRIGEDTEETKFCIDSYDHLYNYVKKIQILYKDFLNFYNIKSPAHYLILNQIFDLVDLYYEYHNKLLNIDELGHILQEISLDDKEIFEELKIKIISSVNNKKLEFTNTDKLIRKKLQSTKDILRRIHYAIQKKEVNLSELYNDIQTKIELYNSETSILKYIFSDKLWYFEKYLHHLKNIYSAIKAHLQLKDESFSFEKTKCKKYFSYVIENKCITLGMIINKYETFDIIQEHVFIVNNIEKQIFEKSTVQLSMLLHSYSANINPISKVIYCDPLPSMLKIFLDAYSKKEINLSISNDYISNPCFKFTPSVSIENTEEFRNKIKKLII